jgi:hypothetical protein
MFSIRTQGCQWVMNSIMALINAGNIINFSSLDKVLRDGDLFCNKIMFEMKAKGTFQSRVVSFE